MSLACSWTPHLNALVGPTQFTPPDRHIHRRDRLVLSVGRCESGISLIVIVPRFSFRIVIARRTHARSEHCRVQCWSTPAARAVVTLSDLSVYASCHVTAATMTSSGRRCHAYIWFRSYTGLCPREKRPPFNFFKITLSRIDRFL